MLLLVCNQEVTKYFKEVLIMTIYYDNLLTRGNIKSIIDNADNHIERPLKAAPYAQARVHNYYNEDGYIVLSILQSYNTLVAAYDFTTNTVYCEGLYSMTTRKHISYFARELNAHTSVALTYSSFKEIA